MNGSGGLFAFFRTDTGVMLAVVLVAFALFALAVFLTRLDRRRREKDRLNAEWQTVTRILAEKELSAAQQKRLRELITRHAPKAPLHAVTVRQVFDGCVDAEMTAAEGNPEYATAAQELREIRARLGLDYVPVGRPISTTRELYTHQTIWMAGPGASLDDWRRMRVEWVDEGYFACAPMPRAGTPPTFAPGDHVRCRMWREDDGRYAFDAQVARIESEPPEWVFSHTKELKRTQTRSFFRLHTEMEAQVAVLNAPKDENYGDVLQRVPTTHFRGRVTSLSAGGCAVSLPQSVPRQVVLRLTFDIGHETPLTVALKLIAITPTSGGRCLARGRFVGIDDATRDLIAQYINRRQIETQALELARK